MELLRSKRARFGSLSAIFALLFTALSGVTAPSANALSTVTTLASGFTWAGSKSTTLGASPAGWSQIVTVNHDDDYQEINLGFNVIFEGVSYNSIQIHSNTYLTFLNNGTTAANDDTASYSDYSSLTPMVPAKPGIHFCSKDNSYQRVYVRLENGNTQYRIRYEGNSGTSGTVGSSGIIYEILLTRDSNVIDVGMGINNSCDSNSGMIGVTNGLDAVMEAQFPNVTTSNGYTVSAGTSFKNNDYRISAGVTVSSFTSAVATPTNTSGDIAYTLTLSESATGLSSADFTNSGTASGCSFSPSASSGTTFTITISGCGEGTLLPQLLANSVTGSLTITGPASNTNASKSISIDRTAPTISSISATNGSYNPVNPTSVNLTVSFSESVTVSGTPRVAITVGAATRYANYVSLTDSKTATFRYTVAVDQAEVDLDGITLISPMETNTGTISDLATNAMTNFSFTVPNTASVYINQVPAAPNIDSITANNTSLTLYFTAGSNNGSTVSNYKYSLNGGAFTALSPTDAISPITISGLTNGTNYQIQIRAVSNLGDGVVSNLMSSAPTASVTLGISLTASATTANKGTLITITAAIGQAGKVTFFWNSERIPGCINKPAVSSATCQWKPNVTGQWSIQAFLKPTDTSYVDSYSPKLPVLILRRSGTR